MSSLTLTEHTAHDPENPFAPRLIQFCRDVINNPQTQHIRVIGVCFGHQILSLALGGECGRGTNGWEVGVYSSTMTPEGRYWWSDSVIPNGSEKIYAEQMHKDNVPTVPPGCTLLMKSERYPVHSFVKHHAASTPDKPLAQVLTIQGHPEFFPELVSLMVDARSGLIFNEEETKEARRRLPGKDGSGGEGEGRIGWAIWRVMLQDLPAK
jgi:GMP synthase-like glutamine amidotransferase